MSIRRSSPFLPGRCNSRTTGRSAVCPRTQPEGIAMNLTEKYRPRTLADVVGQPWATEQLREFTANPVSCAFLFEGATGTGKTSAALALAHDLGVDIAAGPPGGLHQIASGEQTGQSVRDKMSGL